MLTWSITSIPNKVVTRKRPTEKKVNGRKKNNEIPAPRPWSSAQCPDCILCHTRLQHGPHTAQRERWSDHMTTPQK